MFKAYMAKNDISWEEVGRRLIKPRGMIARIKKGEQIPSLETLFWYLAVRPADLTEVYPYPEVLTWAIGVTLSSISKLYREVVGKDNPHLSELKPLNDRERHYLAFAYLRPPYWEADPVHGGIKPRVNTLYRLYCENYPDKSPIDVSEFRVLIGNWFGPWNLLVHALDEEDWNICEE
jgi:transcriptional regulator with XRE-family HTH domain